MPATPEKHAKNDPDGTDFVLKHRIVGAAVLLFFSALFLPWLLGPPGEAISSDSATAAELQNPSGTSETQTIEDELLAAIEQGRVQAPVAEQVYISKITPLDEGRGSRSGPAPVDPATIAPAKLALVSNAADSVVAAPGSLASSPTPGIAATSVSAEVVVAADSSAVPPKAEAITPAAIKVDVGWVVQVGVFTDKRGAAKVVQDLKEKGFDPVTTIVDTNRGAATGTRIWLGPFTQRVDAAKAKTQLKNKTGEAGFIRAFP